MRRVFPLIITALLCLSLAGCSLRKEYDLCGKEQVEALREEAKGWRSGRYLLTNLDTDVMDQAFSFMYNSDGSQTYLYEKVSGDSYYAEYSDGKTLYTLDNGTALMIKEGAENYVSYSGENPHPYSTGDLLFYENLFVSSSEEAADGDNTIYRYYYNVEKINETLGTKLTEFVTEYAFDGGGNFLYFTQRNSDGEKSYAYRIDVTDVNGLTEIENPILEDVE